jgi:competence protein ComEA
MRRYCIALVLALLGLGAPPLHGQEKAPAAKASAPAAAPVNINSASVAELDALPGIGTKTAELIVEHRKKNGNFKKVEELMNIKGIGEKSFLRIKPLVTVGAGQGAKD